MREKPEIKAVIFDIGGVVIKWDDDMVYRHASRITGMPLRRVQSGGERCIKGFEKGRTTERQFWKCVEKAAGCRGSIKGDWLEHYVSHAKRNPEVAAAVRKLRKNGYAVAALTNVNRSHYRHNKKTGLYRLFDRVFASCRLGMRKPDRKLYLYTLRKMKLRPAECVFIDNDPGNVAAARKLGIRSVTFRNAAQMRRELRKLGVEA